MSAPSLAHVTTPDGQRLAYRERGPAEAPTVVLLHSLGADGRMWSACLDELPEDMHAVVPDTRGHGGSTGAATSLSTWTADLNAVVSATSDAPVLLVGVSMGGIQALNYAASHPERVHGVVVADSFAALPDEVAKTKIVTLAGQALTSPMSAVADQYITDTFEAPYPTGAESVRTAMAGMATESYVAAVETCFGADILDRLPQVTAQVRVLWGDRDAKTPLPLSEQIADGVPHATLGVVPGAGHLSNIDNPAAFASEVVDFLRSLDHHLQPSLKGDPSA